MKCVKLILLSFVFCVCACNSFAANVTGNSSKTTIQGSVSLSDSVPSGFYGCWKVISVRSKSTNNAEFGEFGVDLWNLSKSGDVITLSNPVSGAKASVLVSEVNGNTVKFKKVSRESDEESIETPILTLEGDNFYGIDRIVIRSYKNGKFVREESVEYKVKATKVSGATIPELFGYTR